MSILAPIIFLAASIQAMPPAPVGDEYPLFEQTPTAIITEAFDYGGTKSTLKARVTPESAKLWCKNWFPSMKSCAADSVSDEHVYEATANCETGDLWTNGKHYLFDGPETKDRNFEGYVGIKDAETGKRLGMADAERGAEFGSLWLKLCPMGWPYKDVPVEKTFVTDEQYGEAMGHNGSLVYNHQRQHIITYLELKASIAGSIKPNTVLFRGWSVPNGRISGIAYTFKKGCAPAPYFVSGYDNGGFQLTLQGKAPVHEGCDVVGYSDKSPNAKLVFDRGE